MSAQKEDSNLVKEKNKKYDGTEDNKEKKDTKKETEVIINGGSTAVLTDDREDFAPALVLSCLVFWLCGVIFGFFAFIIALYGKSEAEKNRSSKKLKIASYVISLLGILVGLAVVVAILCLHKTNERKSLPYY